MDLRVIGDNLPATAATTQSASNLVSHGIDPELERLLDSDPELIEIKERWYSLPGGELQDGGKIEQPNFRAENFVSSPNIVERVKAPTLVSLRYVLNVGTFSSCYLVHCVFGMTRYTQIRSHYLPSLAGFFICHTMNMRQDRVIFTATCQYVRVRHHWC